jgi:hypothetical protein
MRVYGLFVAEVWKIHVMINDMTMHIFIVPKSDSPEEQYTYLSETLKDAVRRSGAGKDH